MFNYDWDSCTLVVNGVEIDAFDSGDDVVQMTRRTDSFADIMGANGDMMVSKQTDKSGTITFRLLQGSESNTYMSSLCAINENGVFVPTTVQFADTLTGDLGSGTAGYITRPADMSRGVNANSQTWVIVVERLDLLFQGS